MLVWLTIMYHLQVYCTQNKKDCNIGEILSLSLSFCIYSWMYSDAFLPLTRHPVGNVLVEFEMYLLYCGQLAYKPILGHLHCLPDGSRSSSKCPPASPATISHISCTLHHSVVPGLQAIHLSSAEAWVFQWRPHPSWMLHQRTLPPS